MLSIGRESKRILYTGAAVLLCLASLSAVRGAGAQSTGCDDPDTVACIPTAPVPPAPAAEPAAAGGVSSAAAAQPIGPLPPIYRCPAPPPPPPYPYPYPQPYPIPASGAAASAAAAPAPQFCFNDIFTTLNRANLAYARAMRSLDTSQLRGYWSQDALSGLQSQISYLRSSGSYQVLHLLSIQVLDQSYGPYGAWVHTSEHWISETWSFDGYRYDSSDSWYDNQYYLYRSAGGWVIGTDIVQ